MVRIGAWSAISNFPKDYHNCAHVFIHSSKDDNLNIGFIFLFIGNATYSTLHYSVESTASKLVVIGK